MSIESIVIFKVTIFLYLTSYCRKYYTLKISDNLSLQQIIIQKF